MTKIAALILTEDIQGATDDITVAGLNLAERAVLAVHRAGLDRINVVGERLPEPKVLQRLRRRGVDVTFTSTPGRPFEAAPQADLLVVLPVTTIVEPRAIASLLEHVRLRPSEAALAIDARSEAQHRLVDVSNDTIHSVLADGNAASTGLAVFTPEAVESVRKARSSSEALQKLARAGGLRAVSLEPHFCERLVKATDAGRVEHDYIRHLNGGSGESFFTKRIRRLSIPLSRRLLRLPITANQVTMLGLALGVIAGLAFGAGGYWAGLAGAALYYASTVFDCSDGEVARAKYCESAFGCWLETWVDYASYVFALAGITWTTIRSYGYGAHAQAAALAVGASLLMFALVNHFRRRVAAANPGQFDDSLAATFAAEGAVYRFSGWARQWIKRSSLTHVLLVLALINQLHVVLFLWAFGASTALVLALTVRRFLLSRVTVTELRATPSVGVSTHA